LGESEGMKETGVSGMGAAPEQEGNKRHS
jgi:hypothetical protein